MQASNQFHYFEAGFFFDLMFLEEKVIHISTCKFHKEIPCIATLNKQKGHYLFFYKIREQEGRTGPVEG
jgi:hypothetical protein